MPNGWGGSKFGHTNTPRIMEGVMNLSAVQEGPAGFVTLSSFRHLVSSRFPHIY